MAVNKKTTTETLHYEEEFMRHLNLSGMAVCIFLVAAIRRLRERPGVQSEFRAIQIGDPRR
jgi:hypothetical protein